MTGNEIRHGHVIGGTDRFVPEAQMALGHTAGFLGVIFKVCLCILIGIVPDDLDGVLVGADRAVGAQSPELAGQNGLSGSHDVFPNGKGTHRHIVMDAHGEVILLLPCHIIKHRFHMGGDGILGRQSVTSAQDFHGPGALTQGGAHIFVQRFTHASRLLSPIQHRNDLCALGDRFQQMRNRERPVQMDLYHTDLLPLLHQIVHYFHSRFTDRTHGDNDPFRLMITVVIEQFIVSSGNLVDGVHFFLDHFRQPVICRIAGLSALEEGIRILQGGADRGVLGIQSMIPEIIDPVPVYQLGKVLIIQHIDFLDLMTGTESVKEMHEGNGSLDST